MNRKFKKLLGAVVATVAAVGTMMAVNAVSAFAAEEEIFAANFQTNWNTTYSSIKDTTDYVDATSNVIVYKEAIHEHTTYLGNEYGTFLGYTSNEIKALRIPANETATYSAYLSIKNANGNCDMYFSDGTNKLSATDVTCTPGGITKISHTYTNTGSSRYLYLYIINNSNDFIDNIIIKKDTATPTTDHTFDFRSMGALASSGNINAYAIDNEGLGTINAHGRFNDTTYGIQSFSNKNDITFTLDTSGRTIVTINGSYSGNAADTATVRDSADNEKFTISMAAGVGSYSNEAVLDAGTYTIQLGSSNPYISSIVISTAGTLNNAFTDFSCANGGVLTTNDTVYLIAGIAADDATAHDSFTITVNGKTFTSHKAYEQVKIGDRTILPADLGSSYTYVYGVKITGATPNSAGFSANLATAKNFTVTYS